MFSFLTIGAAWFAFGYCVSDIILTRKRNKKLDKLASAFRVEGK